MPEQNAGESLSRSVYLALKDEQRLVRDGYEFLDEKRILLASELLQERDRYREASREFEAHFGQACAALRQAIAQHGLDGVQVQPAPDLADLVLHTVERPYVGMRLLESKLETGEAVSLPDAFDASPEVRTCAGRFLELLALSTRLAALSCNIQRLKQEYRRTERRTRALENVILPELGEALAQAEAYLEMLDQEEVVRVRFRAGDLNAAG